VETLDGQRVTVSARREVILCAGAINSPQLLFLSGIGDEDMLRKVGVIPRIHVPGVGVGLQDHPSIGLVFRAKPGIVLPPRADLGGAHTTAFVQSPVAKALEAADGHQRGPDVQILFASRMLTSEQGIFQSIAERNPELMDPDRDFLRRLVLRTHVREHVEAAETSSATIWVGLVLNQVQSRGRVSLAKSDPHAPPIIDPGICTHPDDLAAMVWGLKKCREIALSEPLASWIEDMVTPQSVFESDSTIEAFIRANAQTNWHYSASLQMGVRSEAVVDTQLRFMGIQGLRVADASVMPTPTSGNINAPTLMIGHRTADFILDDYSGHRAEDRQRARL